MKDNSSAPFRLAAILSILLLLPACAATPEARLQKAYKRVAKTPFEQRPHLYAQLEREGVLTAHARAAWVADWQQQKKAKDARQAELQREARRLAEQRRRAWESLTPAQRFALEMRERELQQQQAAMAFYSQQQEQARRQAAVQGILGNLQRQQEIQAYENRTRALQRPVDVRVHGTINHNFNGTLYIP